MKEEKTAYYLVKDTGLIAKGCDFRFWIYRQGRWEEDRDNLIMDMLTGYDSSEPEGSPYGFGSTSVMDEIEEISFEEAMKRIGSQN